MMIVIRIITSRPESEDCKSVWTGLRLFLVSSVSCGFSASTEKDKYLGLRSAAGASLELRRMVVVVGLNSTEEIKLDLLNSPIYANCIYFV